MPMIHLVRHAQASFGSDDYDVLSDLGRRQAELLDVAFRARGVTVARTVCGSLVRQVDTIRACRSVGGGEPVIDPRWNEYDSADVVACHARLADDQESVASDLGAPKGMTSESFQALLDDALLEWMRVGEDTACTESWAAFQGRAVDALQEVAAGLGRGEDALIVSSGGTIAAAVAALLGAPQQAFLALNRMAVNTGVTKIMVGRSGLNLLSYNDHAHVEQDRSTMTFR